LHLKILIVQLIAIKIFNQTAALIIAK